MQFYFLFINQLTIDYHHTICESIQETLPVLCDMYNLQLKPEVKVNELISHCLYSC